MDVNITFQRKGGFGKIGPRTIALLAKVVSKTAHDVEAEAKTLIMSGPKTGRKYGSHQASAPGEAPATDSGNLVNNPRVVPKGKLESWIVSSTPYSLSLEYGTRKMAARPFMTPATVKMRVPFRKACEIAIRKGARN